MQSCNSIADCDLEDSFTYILACIPRNIYDLVHSKWLIIAYEKYELKYKEREKQEWEKWEMVLMLMIITRKDKLRKQDLQLKFTNVNIIIWCWESRSRMLAWEFKQKKMTSNSFFQIKFNKFYWRIKEEKEVKYNSVSSVQSLRRVRLFI